MAPNNLDSVSAVRRSNPLALAVLVTLGERPMHPYEIGRTLKERSVHEGIRLNYGTLYGVVAALEKCAAIEATETTRDGRRPERTVYRLTPAGRHEAEDWLTELLSEPRKEFLQFEAALTLVAALDPATVTTCLRRRAALLETRVAQVDAQLHVLRQRFGLPRLFVLEGEYSRAMLAAEQQFVQALIDELADDRFDGQQAWRQWSQANETGAGAPPTLELPVRRPEAQQSTTNGPGRTNQT